VKIYHGKRKKGLLRVKVTVDGRALRPRLDLWNHSPTGFEWGYGGSLHSYRYAWTERARKSGYPERFAQEAFGHNSKAVHRAYARKAKVIIPTLESYENQSPDNVVVPLFWGLSRFQTRRPEALLLDSIIRSRWPLRLRAPFRQGGKELVRNTGNEGLDLCGAIDMDEPQSAITAN
jgi:hypothetical protein